MKISPEIELLPIEDKLQLVNDLWDSIQHQSIPINTDQMKETQKRIERFNSGKTNFYSWQDVKNELSNLK